MPFFTPNWRPASFYDRVAENAGLGLHTLVLLDIKVKEQSAENMARGRRVFEPARFMTAAQCAGQMLEIEHEKAEGVCAGDRLAIGAARVGGGEEQRFACGTLAELAEVDLGGPLHCLVLLGRRTHELEKEFVRDFVLDERTFEASWTKYHSGR